MRRCSLGAFLTPRHRSGTGRRRRLGPAAPGRRRRVRAGLRPGQAAADDRHGLGRAAAGRRPAAGLSIDIEPLDLAWAKLQLDARRNALESSPPTPGRMVAIEQIAGLRMAYERRTTLPMRHDGHAGGARARSRHARAADEAATPAVQGPGRGATAAALGAARRLAGGAASAPAAARGRGLPVETGTVARTYPFSAGTLQLEGGVPFGVAASSPVTFTVARRAELAAKAGGTCAGMARRAAARATSCECYLSREHFANGLRVYGIDQDEQQEYAGRFCDYLGGSTVPIRTSRTREAFHFRPRSPDPERGRVGSARVQRRGRARTIFAELKAKLCAYLLASKKVGAWRWWSTRRSR